MSACVREAGNVLLCVKVCVCAKKGVCGGRHGEGKGKVGNGEVVKRRTIQKNITYIMSYKIWIDEE